MTPIRPPVRGDGVSPLAIAETHDDDAWHGLARWLERRLGAARRWPPALRRGGRREGDAIEVRAAAQRAIPPAPIDGGSRRCYVGRISGLTFDRVGEFVGFLLETNAGERSFHSRAPDVQQQCERAWADRMRIGVWVEGDDPSRPDAIAISPPPPAS